MTELVLLSGFLGAGKTTTMLAAAKLLARRGRKVSVVTNDQAAGLVDTELARRSLPLVDEITGGCFCCRFEDLDAVVRRLVDSDGVDTVLAEAVGSCTDLRATVVRPLRRFYGSTLRLAPLTTLVDPQRWSTLVDARTDLGYLFRLQLAESDIIVLNKRDLYSEAELSPIVARLREEFPSAVVRTCSATTADGLDELLDTWETADSVRASLDRDLDVDYDRYAAAEAELAWLNRSVALTAVRDSFTAKDWADEVLRVLADECRTAGHDIGHAKLALVTEDGLVKLSVTASGAEPTIDATVDHPVARASATLNVRVTCPPERLDSLARKAIASADEVAGVRSDLLEGAAFRPAYPRPTHRITA